MKTTGSVSNHCNALLQTVHIPTRPLPPSHPSFPDCSESCWGVATKDQDGMDVCMTVFLSQHTLEVFFIDYNYLHWNTWRVKKQSNVQTIFYIFSQAVSVLLKDNTEVFIWDSLVWPFSAVLHSKSEILTVNIVGQKHQKTFFPSICLM